MGRRLKTLGIFLSLLACIAIAALWRRSYVAGDFFQIAVKSASDSSDAADTGGTSVYRTYSIRVGEGQVDLQISRRFADSGRGRWYIERGSGVPFNLYLPDGSPLNRMGFDHTEAAGYSSEFIFPLWFVLLLAALAPIFWLVQRRAARRVKDEPINDSFESNSSGETP